MRVNSEPMVMQPMSFEKMASKSTRPMSYVGHVPQRPSSVLDPSRYLNQGPKPWEKMEEPFDANELCRKLNRYKMVQDDREMREARILELKERRQQEQQHEQERLQQQQLQIQLMQQESPDEFDQLDPLSPPPDALPVVAENPDQRGPYRHRPRYAAKSFQGTVNPDPNGVPAKSPWGSLSHRASVDLREASQTPDQRRMSYVSSRGSDSTSHSRTTSIHRRYKSTDRPNWSQDDEKEVKEKKRWSIFREKPTPAATLDEREEFVFPPHPAVHPLGAAASVPNLKEPNLKERRRSRNLFKKVVA